MFWFALGGRRGRLPLMTGIMGLEWRGEAAQECSIGAGGQGRGPSRLTALPNEPEESARFNGLAICESRQIQFPVPPGLSP